MKTILAIYIGYSLLLLGCYKKEYRFVSETSRGRCKILLDQDKGDAFLYWTLPKMDRERITHYYPAFDRSDGKHGMGRLRFTLEGNRAHFEGRTHDVYIDIKEEDGGLVVTSTISRYIKITEDRLVFVKKHEWDMPRMRERKGMVYRTSNLTYGLTIRFIDCGSNVHEIPPEDLVNIYLIAPTAYRL